MLIVSPKIDADIGVGVSELTKAYGSTAAPVYALRGVTLDVARGERVALLGKSGSGKVDAAQPAGRTRSRHLGRACTWAGRDVGRLSRRELARFRSATVGMIFQSFNLIPSRTALENVELPMIFAGRSPARAPGAGQRGPGVGRPGRTPAPSPDRDERRREPARGGGAAPWSTAPRSCWPTSRPATSTAARRTR